MGSGLGNYSITYTDGSLTVIAPPVTLTSVQKKTNKKHQVTEILLTFSGGLNPTQADSTTNFQLKNPGRRGLSTAKNAKAIKLRSAVYNSATTTVAITPKKPFTLAKPVQLQVSGVPPTGLEDTFGRFIDGNDDGQPGGNAVAVLRNSGVVFSTVSRTLIPSARTQTPPPSTL